MRERTRLENGIGAYEDLAARFAENTELVELAEAEGEADVAAEAEAALAALRDQAARLRLQSMLSGEADGNDCYLEVHAGAGGTESQDWTQMLLRMYVRWAEQHGYKVEYLEESPGEEAGLKSATIRVVGNIRFVVTEFFLIPKCYRSTFCKFSLIVCQSGFHIPLVINEQA